MIKARRRLELPASRAFAQAGKVASDPRAPALERFQAHTEVAREASEYSAQFDARQLLTAARLLAKADDVPLRQRRGVAKVSVDLADNSHVLNLTRPVGLDFPQLRAISANDPSLLAIQWTLIRYAQRFLQYSAKEWQPGFRFRFRDGRDVEDADRVRFAWLASWLLNCGAENHPRERARMGRFSLREFVAMHLQDSLALDAAPIELVPTLRGRIHGFVPVDGARVYLTDPVRGLPAGQGEPALHARLGVHVPHHADVIAVLTRNGVIEAWYTDEDLHYPLRRPSTNLYRYGYGQPEPEELIKIITGFVNALTLNMRGFTHNSIPQGILTVFGDFTEEDIEQFKSEWDAYVSGLVNRWRMPILINREGAQGQAGATFTPTSANFNEMYFAKWMTFLLAIKAALYGIDPTEVNFEAFTTKTSNLSGEDTTERLANSKNKGIWPLLDYLQAVFNDILYHIDPDVELYFTGLLTDQLRAKEEQEKAQTYEEYRRERGLPPTGIPELDGAPMYTGLIGVYTTAMQQQAQARQAAEAGMGQIDGEAGMEPSGEVRDVDGDGELEQGIDLSGDGHTDAWQDIDEEGNRILLDHQGNRYRVDRADEGPPRLAKAATVDLERWP